MYLLCFLSLFRYRRIASPEPKISKEDTSAEPYPVSNVGGTTPLQEERVEAETKAETITPFQVEQAEDRAISPAPGAPLNEEEDYHITVWGDDPEIQAMSELYDRPVILYAYDAVT